jgi:8-oxo-dGTP pyrophosphatase MutT (NUDIX family)
MRWLRPIDRWIRPLYQVHSRLMRGMTLGVRGLVVDAEGRVLLIKHTYTPGWYMPGGGIERGETAEQALERELLEEAGVRMTARARLLSFHSNETLFRGDHVLIYRIEQFETGEPSQTGEIEEIAWFSPDDLPPDVTRATRARLAEALLGSEPHPHW